MVKARAFSNREMFTKPEYPAKLTPGRLVLSAVNAEYVE
jgi:hypothetical protein